MADSQEKLQTGTTRDKSTEIKGNPAAAATEFALQRNPHPEFKKVEAARTPYVKTELSQTQTPMPSWTAGSGANNLDPHWKFKSIVDIDPYEDGRPAGFNYKLLISAIIPRPIGFISTIDAAGRTNLAPFSYTQFVNHDPPIFVVGVAGSLRAAKDTLKNIIETDELVINLVSEHFIEAANYTAINAPAQVSEWALSGLTPLPSVKVRPPRVHESIFTVECKLVEFREWKNRDGKETGVTIFAEAVMFHCREDAINEEKNLVDAAVLRPVCRLGGISYSTIDSAFELARPDFDTEMKKEEFRALVEGFAKR